MSEFWQIPLLVAMLLFAYVLPFASERAVGRALAHSAAWHAKSPRTRRRFARAPGLVIVAMITACFVIFRIPV